MLERFEHWLLPPRCLLCGGPGHGLELCAGCDADLPRIPANRLVPLPPPVTLIPFYYSFPLDRLILATKFAGNLAAGTVIGELLARTVLQRGHPLPDGLLPVPLHPDRLRERGYNQAAVLAAVLGARLGVPVLEDLCVRVRHTPPQAALPAHRRRSNLRGAFRASCQHAVPARVAVVDDVCTTGSTLRAVAQALEAAGILHIEAWCACLTPFRH